MRLKWGKEEIKYFTKPIPKAENPNYDWIFWLILAACSLAGLGYLIWQVM